MMQYDDDFDEEEAYQQTKKGTKYRVDVLAKTSERPREDLIEGISEINPSDKTEAGEEDEDDDMLDDLDKFIEGNDTGLVKDRSEIF